MFDSDAFRDIYIIFMNANYPGDWMYKDGFKHVYAVERQAAGWLCVDPSRSNLFTCILPAIYETEVMETFAKLNPDATIVNIHVKSNGQGLYPTIGVLSCVSVTQYLIGVSWPFVLTPYQLYNKIITKPPNHIEVIKCQAHQPAGNQETQPEQPELIRQHYKSKQDYQESKQLERKKRHNAC